MDLDSAISAFGAAAKARLSNVSVSGQPEDQLRTPFSNLIEDLAEVVGLPRQAVSAVGETLLSDLKTRPDYSVTVRSALVGHVELKAPGKGADPRKFKDPHDKAQWEKLKSLPNLMYSDGNQFSLWRNGENARAVVRLDGDVETSGAKLQAPALLLNLFRDFFEWSPQPPRSAKELAHVSAHLCRLLRDEVTEQMALGSEALTSLADDWRKLLFPEATDERFADGYAQAVTFGLLMARAKGIPLASGFHTVAQELGQTSSLIGAALRLLTDNAENQATLKTSLQTLIRVLDAVDWPAISKGDPEAWLYFYEDFLEVYDNALRKLTGSYYTPPEVVKAMVRLVDEELRGPRYGLSAGVASPSVTLADPATGTGTFLLGILRKIAETVAADEGPGAVTGAINDAVKRLIAFEMQLGPFAVAQLRILAEIVELTGAPPTTSPRMFVTNTLGDPDDDEGWIPGILSQIASSRRDANKIKRDEPITVVIGNPPYKEKAMGMGAWVEGQASDKNRWTPLKDWLPPSNWGVGVYARHLRNLYIYFWRWATWKVFDHGPGDKAGMVSFITMSGFLAGSGFQRMRDYLRRTCDQVWVIDCSPEGHQPEVNTRIFQGVQQPICIVLASRSGNRPSISPAEVRWRSLPRGDCQEKFEALAKIELASPGWIECPQEWRAPFLPNSTSVWSSFPALDDLFMYNGTGVMAGRTWIFAPDQESLKARWQSLIKAADGEKEVLFHPHLRDGKPGDKHTKRVVSVPLAGFEPRVKPIADETGDFIPSIVPYAFRSFDRQWILPDSRLINQPNPELWSLRSRSQVFLTAPSDKSPSNGPALTVTDLVPDVHHYNGRGGRFFPLWRDANAGNSNFRPRVLEFLSQRFGHMVNPEDLFAYVVAATSHSGFTASFREDLSTPGLRIPLAADKGLFKELVEVGRSVIWLQTFGERMADPARNRPAGPPRLALERRPQIPAEGAIPQDAGGMPDSISYDASKKRLLIGTGYVENVEPAVWNYEVSGKHVLRQWFSYRKANRERPMIGDRRTPSPLGDIQPDHWLSEYTTELINVLNVLTMLVELEPGQAELLEKVCSGPLISAEELRLAGAFEVPNTSRRRIKRQAGPNLFESAGL